MESAQLQNVTKTYGPIPALTQVDLTIPPGKIIALLGPNGAGKTTAVKLLLGLLTPTSGTARVFGQDPRNPANRRRTGAMLQVGRVPETLRVREHIDLFSSYYPNPLTMGETLAAAGLEDVPHRMYGQLSGGQKQRVLFALAICGDPDGRSALEAVLAHQPDVLITDIEMPGMTGLELAAELQARKTGTRVIILTTFARASYLRRALTVGALGYVLKDRPARELADAVRRVHAGLRVIDPELAAEAWGEPDPLTDRERQVLRLAGEGTATTAIARQLHLSEGTVRNYLSEAISKLGVANRIEAARLARSRGWL